MASGNVTPQTSSDTPRLSINKNHTIMKREDIKTKYEEVMGVPLTWHDFLLGMAMVVGLIVICVLGELVGDFLVILLNSFF